MDKKIEMVQVFHPVYPKRAYRLSHCPFILTAFVTGILFAMLFVHQIPWPLYLVFVSSAILWMGIIWKLNWGVYHDESES